MHGEFVQSPNIDHEVINEAYRKQSVMNYSSLDYELNEMETHIKGQENYAEQTIKMGEAKIVQN